MLSLNVHSKTHTGVRMARSEQDSSRSTTLWYDLSVSRTRYGTQGASSFSLHSYPHFNTLILKSDGFITKQ